MCKETMACVFFVILLFSTTGSALNSSLGYETDFDPLVDISVTVEVQKIRSLEKHDRHLHVREYVDRWSAPDFYVKVFINDMVFKSGVWHESRYIYDPGWSATVDVPDEVEFVDIKIQLWDFSENGASEDRLCDISDDYGDSSDCFDVELVYSIKTGHWRGDDSLGDPSGYGRLNGCDDGTIYRHDRDCELWFNIYHNDSDGDGIPYWMEVNVFGTDPEVDNTGEDMDGDGVPVDWEWRWRYDPLMQERHIYIDPDSDGLNNVEEYLTSRWDSDPFRKDLFIELDQMMESPRGEKSLLPEGAKELLYTAHDRQNVVYHLDDGSWEGSGSDMIPFDDLATYEELQQIYWNYFLHGDEGNWRRGVFRYGVVIYQGSHHNGNAFGSNRFQISSNGMEKKARSLFLDRDVVYASAYMHETGHTLGFWPIYGHNDFSKYPWQIGWWIWRPYKSCMNYGYMYWMVDYSDGSRGRRDLNDWSRMDLTYFQK
jgi:hypothetical protein